MTAIKIISETPQTCARCVDLGLPPEGIAPGRLHVLLTSPRVSLRSCWDCIERLLGEIHGNTEGEEWKAQG